MKLLHWYEGPSSYASGSYHCTMEAIPVVHPTYEYEHPNDLPTDYDPAEGPQIPAAPAISLDKRTCPGYPDLPAGYEYRLGGIVLVFETEAGPGYYPWRDSLGSGTRTESGNETAVWGWLMLGHAAGGAGHDLTNRQDLLDLDGNPVATHVSGQPLSAVWAVNGWIYKGPEALPDFGPSVDADQKVRRITVSPEPSSIAAIWGSTLYVWGKLAMPYILSGGVRYVSRGYQVPDCYADVPWEVSVYTWIEVWGPDDGVWPPEGEVAAYLLDEDRTYLDASRQAYEPQGEGVLYLRRSDNLEASYTASLLPFTGKAPSILCQDSGRILIGYNDAGAIKLQASDNDGETWGAIVMTPEPTGYFSDLWTDRNNPESVLLLGACTVATGDGDLIVYRSWDQGATRDAGSVTVVANVPAQRPVLTGNAAEIVCSYFLSTGAIAKKRSFDQGATWS